MRKPPSFVLMSGLLFITIGVVQLGYLVMQAAAEPQAKSVQIAGLGDFFEKQAARSTPFDSQKRGDGKLVRKHIDVFEHNPIQGARHSDVELIIFTDMLCGSCREQAQQTLLDIGAYRSKVRIVYKFKPQDDHLLDGGIFEQIAARQGIYDALQKEASQVSGGLEVSDLVGLLEKAGLPFDKQRAAMSVHMASILSGLQEDMAQAKNLNVRHIPTFYLNGYELDQPDLPARHIAKYVETLLARENLKPMVD